MTSAQSTAETGRRREELPPRPAFSATQQMLRWLGRPFDLLRECAEQLGDAFTLDFGSHGTYVLFSRPDTIKAIFTASATKLHAGKGNSVLLPLLGPGSLLLLEEDRHARERRLLMPAFHARRVEAYGEMIRDAAIEACQAWAPGDQIVIQEAMQRISLTVILRAVLGAAPGTGPDDELGRRFQAFWNDPRFNLASLNQLHEDLGNAAWARFRQSVAEVDRVLFEQIAARRSRPDPGAGDMLGMLLDARYDDGSTLDDAALRDELMTLLATGYETTATALAWAFHWLHREPDTLARLRAEIAAIGPDSAAAASSSRAEYLRAVCAETLRVQPILPMVARQVQEPVELQGHLIPEGVIVAPCIYLAHHRADVFHEPDRFRPERFLEREYSPHEYLPFGGGPRRCLGAALALHEMKIVLAAVLSRVELAAIGAPVRPVRRTVTLAPSGGTRMQVVRRLS